MSDIEPTRSEIRLTIETPVPGVVIIDVTLSACGAPGPLHWRAGSWTKPPLDVTVDREGRLMAIQFVLQDERVELGGELQNQCEVLEIGLPRFDVGSWPENRYWDERLPVAAHRTGAGELVLRIGEQLQLHRRCAPNPGLLLAFDHGGCLAAIKIGPMTIDDWASIDAFSVGTLLPQTDSVPLNLPGFAGGCDDDR